MERKSRLFRLALLLGVLLLGTEVQAQWEVEIGIKQTDGRWQDTLVAGDTCILTISVTNPIPVAAYAIPFLFTSETHGAFAQSLGEPGVSYVGRMADPTIFTIRSVNSLGVDGASPDSLLYGAVEFGSNNLPVGTGIIIEQLIYVQPYVGSVRIDTGLIPPANQLAFTDSDANEYKGIPFNANPVFPVVLRVPNGGPTCGGPSDINAPFGAPLSNTVTATDPEGDPLVFAQVSGPGNTSGAGVWNWSPGCPDVGSYEVCVTVSDPSHLDWDTCCFMVTVTQESPALTCDDQVAHYADPISYFLNGSDDGCPATLRYFKTSGPGTINPSTGEYTWLPGCGNVGFHFINAGVTDGLDTVLCTFRIDVTNNPPIINCPPNFSVGIGDTVDFLIPASDPDGDAIAYTLLDFVKLSGPTGGGPNSPATLSTAGQFFWPTSDANDDDFGVWEVSLRVDESCDSAFCTFEIEVTPNRPPVCIPPNDFAVHWTEGTVQVQFEFYDPDGDALTFSQISGPGTLDSTATWSWSFGCDDRGVYQVCAVVADSAFPGGDTCCFTFSVVQTAPNLQCHDDSVHAGAGPLQIQLAAPDDGCPGNPVRFYMISGPGEVDSVTGLYTLTFPTPSFGCDDIGDYEVTVGATDGERASSCVFTASVYNNPPKFECPFDTLRHTSDQLFTFGTDVIDPDGDDILMLFIRSFDKLSGPVGGPNHAPSVDSTGLVTWQTDSSNADDLGLWRLILEARDTCGLSRCTLLVNVFHNSPPVCLTGDISGHVGDTARGGALGVDVDEDSLSFTLISGPGWIEEVKNAVRWRWIPECSDLGTYEVCLTVSDPVHPDADTCCFLATIFENAPVIHCSTRTVHYGETVAYDIAFEDDACPSVATWSLVSGPGTIDTITGRYTLSTACPDVGTIPVTVALYDGNRADTCTFDVVVANEPPFVECPANMYGLKVGVTVDVDIPFGDPDGDSTTIGMVSFQKLGGANTNPANNAPTLDAAGHFQWITDWSNLDDVATWEVSVRVDELCDSAFCSFRIEILPNEAPECASPSDTEATCNELITRAFDATDVEGDSLTFTQISGPGAVDAATGVWSWTPPCDSGGLYEVCATVSDVLHPDADACCFLISICAVALPGDVNGDNMANAEDIILLVNFMFKSGDMPYGQYTADMDCDGVTNTADIIVLVNYVFKSGPEVCNACSSPLFPGLGP